MNIRLKILEIATGYLGKSEEPGNEGWYDSDFEAKMKRRGWKQTEAWCSYFAELVWFEAYAHFTIISSDIDRLFSGSAVETYRHFSEEIEWEVNKQPAPGALAIFQRYKEGKPHWSGHVAIVESCVNGVLITIDGNSNEAGVRDGGTVARCKRVMNFKPIKNGLVLLGFVHPQDIEI